MQRNGAARLDHVHSQIAQRLGPDGWSILQRLDANHLAQIEGMQRQGNLTDGVLQELRGEAALQREGAR
ncbi:MAG: hypothetical protein Q8L13_19195 [Bradyrhizobium sp.]|uniref:hypothetical protein n=1 Tax=Bradyrhizobium sp. TaxID=376 RepID=UPI00272EEF5A|nr:hypothetical protein [Bradyrhizobium sp.]MDP1868449.1 hypothetical protein [Bradyrhizobium sp.]